VALVAIRRLGGMGPPLTVRMIRDKVRKVLPPEIS
jgi:hypothetical protein